LRLTFKTDAMKHLILLFASFYLFVFSAQSQNKEGNFHLDKEYKISSIGNLKLSCSDAKVFITGSSRSTAHIKIDRDVDTKGFFFGNREFTVDITETDGNLEIKERSNGSVSMIGYYNVKYTITIEVPEGINLKVKGDDGDYFLKSVNGSIDLDVDDADVQLASCKGNDFKFRLDDGYIKMDEGKGKIEIDGDDSDIDIRNASFTSVNANVDDGDFVIQTSIADNGKYSIDGQDGLISFTVLGGGGTFEIHHDDSRVTAENGFVLEEKTDNRTRFTLASGNAQIDLRADDARVKLNKI
jgi:Putative adhesin